MNIFTCVLSAQSVLNLKVIVYIVAKFTMTPMKVMESVGLNARIAVYGYTKNVKKKMESKK